MSQFKITEEEFQRAQVVIHEYHRERQQQADLELEEDDPMFEDDEEDIEERRENERFERALNCTCGAWVINQNKVLHVADCVCGAE
jgi:hypothetical protein